jgi:hypothetical protein
MLEYDLDQDPTQEMFELDDEFLVHQLSAFLSAQFIHRHLFDSRYHRVVPVAEPTNAGDEFFEFIEPAAMASVGPHDEVTPSFAVDSSEALENWKYSDYGYLSLEGTVPAPDPFPVMSMDLFSQRSYESNVEATIDPALLRHAPAFSEQRSPTPDFSPFNNSYSRNIPHTSSPASTPRNFEGKFYKRGTLQTLSHRSNSQSRRTTSPKTNPSASRQLSSNQAPDSPLAELSASDNASTSSHVSPTEVVNIADNADSDSDTLPSVTSAKTPTSQKQKSGTNTKGPYHIVAVNKSSHCHQCRRATPHPKMTCRTCARLYCILCIVKRYVRYVFVQDSDRFRFSIP